MLHLPSVDPAPSAGADLDFQGIMARARLAVLVARDGRDVADAANRAKAEVIEMGADVRVSPSWATAVHSMAQRLRPELVEG